MATLNHINIAHHDAVRCFSTSAWLNKQMGEPLKQRVASLVARISRTVSYRICRACLRVGRFRNHYGFCGGCRPIHKPEVRRRVLIHGRISMPQSFMSMLPRRPGTRQHPVVLEDVWDLFEMVRISSGKRGRAWCKRMQRYGCKKAFIDAFRDLAI